MQAQRRGTKGKKFSGMGYSSSSAVTSDDGCDEGGNGHQEHEGSATEKRIPGLLRKLSVANVQLVANEIMNTNLIEGRGVFCRLIMKFQMVFPRLSNVYAALVAIINSEFPDVGLLLVKRVVLEFKGACECSNKSQMKAALKFLAHLVNQTVVYEVLALDILLLLLGNPCSDNIEVAVSFCAECGSSLQDFAPCKLKGVLREFHGVLREGTVAKRVQVLIVRLFAAEKSKFKEHPGIIDGLDLVEVEDQVTHEVSLLHDIRPETSEENFRVDSNFQEPDPMCCEVTVSDGDSDGDEVSS